MTSDPVLYPLRRWTWVFGLVALIHGGLIAMLARTMKPAEPVVEATMLIDLAPPPAPEVINTPAPALSPPPEVQPPPVDTPAPSEPAPPQPAPPEPAVAEEPPPPEPVPVEATPAPPLPATPLPEVEKPPVVLPRRATAAPRPRPVPSKVAAEPAETKTMESPAPAPAPPAASTAASSQPVSWQTRLLAHLNRFKRFPAEAQMRHRQGSALVHLRLLPDGSVTSVRLQSSSGTDTLDQEAVALISRAQPLPVPDGSTGAIEIAVPIQFTLLR